MHNARTLTMSAKELDRLEVLSRVVERRLMARQAAEQLGLSLRQVERLCRALRADGAAGLVSRKRGRPSNRKLPTAVREHALGLVRARYADFGPTLAREKLWEQLRFVASESAIDSFASTRAYLDRHGKPVAFSTWIIPHLQNRS